MALLITITTVLQTPCQAVVHQKYFATIGTESYLRKVTVTFRPNNTVRESVQYVLLRDLDKFYSGVALNCVHLGWGSFDFPVHFVHTFQMVGGRIGAFPNFKGS